MESIDVWVMLHARWAVPALTVQEVKFTDLLARPHRQIVLVAKHQTLWGVVKGAFHPEFTVTRAHEVRACLRARVAGERWVRSAFIRAHRKLCPICTAWNERANAGVTLLRHTEPIGIALARSGDDWRRSEGDGSRAKVRVVLVAAHTKAARPCANKKIANGLVHAHWKAVVVWDKSISVERVVLRAAAPLGTAPLLQKLLTHCLSCVLRQRCCPVFLNNLKLLHSLGGFANIVDLVFVTHSLLVGVYGRSGLQGCLLRCEHSEIWMVVHACLDLLAKTIAHVLDTVGLSGPHWEPCLVQLHPVLDRVCLDACVGEPAPQKKFLPWHGHYLQT
jgi:hypothetical protein